MHAGPEKKYPFEIEDRSGPKRRFAVRGWPFGTSTPDDKVTVEFVLLEREIAVVYPNPPPDRNLPNLSITQRWDARKEICVLCLNGEEWTNRQISQMAVDPLFFA